MFSPLYSCAAIQDRVQQIAEAMNRDLEGEELVHIIVTMNGTFMFAADLVRRLKFPVMMHFAGSDSYGEGENKDILFASDSLPPSFGNKPVILIEDVIDNGDTLGVIRTIIAEKFAGSIKVAALLKRQGGKAHADYYGFTIPQGVFVVGYGMDMDGRFRELSEIKALSTSTVTGTC